MSMRRPPPAQVLKTIQVAAILISVTLVVAILHLAEVVLVPVALAVLLTFILSPMVMRLDHLGLGRVPAVLIVVGTVGLLLACLTWVVVAQLTALANDLPNYRGNIRAKITTLTQGTSGGVLDKVQATLKDAAEQAEESIPEEGEEVIDEAADQLEEEVDAEMQVESDPEPEVEPVLVWVVPEADPDQAFSAAFSSLLALSPALGGLATAGLALVLVLFMLIDREDLRNRLVSFTAEGNLATTTKALDDAGQRISRYLIMQLIINGTYGLAVSIGLLLIGVPYAFLWGLCAAVFRYIPYIGPWVAALLPLTVSLITSPGWTQVMFVLGLFLVLELLSNNVMEPWLYGHGVGVSVVALLISAAFWTWTWGAIGLVLATPLTVCLVVIGKYVPSLSFLDRLLGDQPALKPHAVFLQRLLARDVDEAAEIVKEYCGENPPETIYEEVFLPALELARQDRNRGTMTAEEESFVLESARSIMLTLSSADDTSLDTEVAAEVARQCQASGDFSSPGEDRRVADGEDLRPLTETQPSVRVLGCPAHKEAEELTLQMLAQLIRPTGFAMEVISTRTLPSDVVRQVRREQPAVVVIAVLLPGGLIQARYLCKALHKRCPNVPIVVGCWGYKGNLDWMIVKLRSAGAHYVTTSLRGARDHVESFAGPSKSAPLGETRTSSTPEPVDAE